MDNSCAEDGRVRGMGGRVRYLLFCEGRMMGSYADVGYRLVQV